MTGIFDSGVGGLAAYREVRRLLPREDIVYLADRKNAPYGTKDKSELIRLVKKDIERLSAMGASRILIACCTASSVYGNLSAEEQSISIPIIFPAAKRAAELGKKIAVIATKHTVASHAFKESILSVSDSKEVVEIEMQRLVALVEEGCCDGKVNSVCEKVLDELSLTLAQYGSEVLILGCTHFSHLEGELQRRLPYMKIVSPARVGATCLSNEIKKMSGVSGNGRTVYT